MIPDTFSAMVVTETGNRRFERKIVQRQINDLPPGELLIRVRYSSLNYKDALSATGNKGVTRAYPHTPGIDAAGTVAQSASPDFWPGDPVIVTGYDLGMNTPGGFGQYIRVPAPWAVPCPQGLTLGESMAFGTAGFTAAICIHKLIQAGVAPDRGPVLVTGATGGVGSLAVAILAKLGFEVTAVSGKVGSTALLGELGAREILSRQEAVDKSGRPMARARWAGVVDTVGGSILATAIRSTRPNGAVTCCGMVAGADLNTTVFPFILRGISLLGADSANFPAGIRPTLWQRLAGDWKIDTLPRLTTKIPLSDLSGRIDRILKGELTGRTVVRIG